ncbi:hypothetical protein GALMADRAFT_592699 [Galerina marginata CBS 339.88]|uniref:Uncharacterized protein n=1 Tax=Galerina marginata (strain CBS 339.88) TaxID=685588 RepID=A0A067SSB8_GALM3|nr:hypothetical protein GALMADRAFT_592699 [Galerina marginata CBS 339.88]
MTNHAWTYSILLPTRNHRFRIVIGMGTRASGGMRRLSCSSLQSANSNIRSSRTTFAFQARDSRTQRRFPAPLVKLPLASCSS